MFTKIKDRLSGRPPVSTPLAAIQPPLRFLAPHPNPMLQRLAAPYAAVYARLRGKVVASHLVNPEPLLEAYQGFYAGNHRLLLAFRHPTHADGPLLYHLLTYRLPRLAREQGFDLPARPQTHFMYDRGIPLWAGSYLEWLLPGLGALSIMRGKADRQGITTARRLIVAGDHPLVVAPEGGNNNLNYQLGPLQPGIVQLAGWAQDDLLKKDQIVPVTILPLGISYRYQTPAVYHSLDFALDRLSEAFGVTGASAPADDEGLGLDYISNLALRRRYERYLAIHAAMLNSLEEYYQRYFEVGTLPAHMSRDARLNWLSDRIFDLGQRRLEVSPKEASAPTDRIYLSEQAAWNHIYRPVPTVPVQRGLADWVATEAANSLRHIRLASSLHRISLAYLFQNPSLERLGDMLVLTWDVMSQSMRLHGKLSLGPREAYFRVGNPITIEPSLSQGSRRSSLAQHAQTLEQEMLRLVELSDPVAGSSTGLQAAL